MVSRRIAPEREMKPHGCLVPTYTIADSVTRACVDNDLTRILGSRKLPQDGIPCNQRCNLLRKAS